MRRTALLVIATLLAAAAAAPPAFAARPAKGARYLGVTTQRCLLNSGLLIRCPIEVRVSRSGRSAVVTFAQVVYCPSGLRLQRVDAFRGAVSGSGRFGGRSEFTEDIPDEPELGPGNLSGAFRQSFTARFTSSSRAAGWGQMHLTARDEEGTARTECDSGEWYFSVRRRRAASAAAAGGGVAPRAIRRGWLPR
jgi:hypothetical protein